MTVLTWVNTYYLLWDQSLGAMGIYEPSETSFDLYSGGTLERSAFIRGMIAFKSKLPIDLSILGHYCWYQCQKKKNFRNLTLTLCIHASMQPLQKSTRSPSTLCLADTVLKHTSRKHQSQFPLPWTSGPEEFEFFACDGNISLLPLKVELLCPPISDNQTRTQTPHPNIHYYRDIVGNSFYFYSFSSREEWSWYTAPISTPIQTQFKS